MNGFMFLCNKLRNTTGQNLKNEVFLRRIACTDAACHILLSSTVGCSIELFWIVIGFPSLLLFSVNNASDGVLDEKKLFRTFKSHNGPPKWKCMLIYKSLKALRFKKSAISLESFSTADLTLYMDGGAPARTFKIAFKSSVKLLISL